MSIPSVGISGIAAHVPPYRVNLADWSRWYGADPDKMRHVIGTGFRMRGPGRSVYTLAATAALRLIEQYDIDPQRVRYLGLGTESSTDNSTGAVILKGMLDDVLQARGQAPLARSCEVPEIKHACLGGIYALQGAARTMAFADPGDCAIVVAADIAEYERGSSGEPTQGAGAVAMLVEQDPKVATVELARAGNATDYRGPDFRKPLQRLLYQAPNERGHLHDFPVFNGRYSTACYIDEVLAALDDLYRRRGVERPAPYLRRIAAAFLHRPYRRMAETGWALAYLAALAAGDDADRRELAELADEAEVSFEGILDELNQRYRLYEHLRADQLNGELHPIGMSAVRAFRRTPQYRESVGSKLALGSERIAELGNLYTAALPAWLAAGLVEASERDLALTGEELLLIGYGSGDAATTLPLRVQPGWQEAARRIQLDRAMADPIDLTQAQYEALHDHGDAPDLTGAARGEFVVSGLGELSPSGLDERGIEFYRYVD